MMDNSCSSQGAPADTSFSTFFSNPHTSKSLPCPLDTYPMSLLMGSVIPIIIPPLLSLGKKPPCLLFPLATSSEV